jgi:hypothetical protein
VIGRGGPVWTCSAPQAAFLGQNQRGDGGDRLGHRRDPEDRVAPGRSGSIDVHIVTLGERAA